MIPDRSQNEAQLSATLSADQRKKVLDRVLAALQKRFYAPEKLNGDWHAAVERHRPSIESANTPADFEKEVSDLLKELQTSHLGFFHRSARRASSRAALSATYLEDQTEYGKRWIFQDVHTGGAASAAGIEPGDILLTVDDQNIIPPEHPVFTMGEKTSVEVIGADEKKRRVIVDVARPKGKKLHFVEPKLVEARHLNDGVGYLKIAMFPGLVGVEVANEISRSLAGLGEIDSLVIDLRGNTGGGIGALRVMSLLTPTKIPVGFALAKDRVTPNLDTVKHSFRRFDSIPESKSSLWLLAAKFGPAMLSKSPIVLEAEGLGAKRFHGRVVVLVDRHTASAAEMIVAFVRENKLAMIVSQLGYEITPGRSGAPEIKGYTQEYLDASSPRSQQIREYLEKSGFAGPEAAQIAAHSTRDKKEIHTPSEVLAAHRQLAAEFGNQANRVVQEARIRANSNEQTPHPNSPERAQEAVTFAKSRNFEREAVTDERDIMRDALRRGMGDLTYGQVRDNFEQRQGTGEFQRAPGQKHDTGRQFTTREAIAEELATIKHMQQGQSTVEPIMREENAADHARTREFLNPTQQKAIEDVLTSQDRIHGLQGLAGSGKTTTLEAIRDGAERNGYAVEGFAPTSRAAGQLRDAGIQADTLQGFLARGGMERSAGDPNARHLYMLDESSLASTRQMQSFLEKIGPQDRVLLVGDTRQHQSVDAGKPFEQMQEAGMRTSQLDQIVRQKAPELLRAVEHLSRNETAIGIQLLQQQGRITEIPDHRQRIEAIARDYFARPENTLVVSPDNASRRDINDAIRAEFQSSGALSKDNHTMTVLTQRSELTSADRNWAALYQPADVLYYTRGSRELGLERGTYATVISTDPKANQLTVEREDGQHVTYDPKRLHGIAAYREIARDFAEGDRLQFTVSKPDMDIKNRDLGTLERIDGTSMTVRMDGDKARTLTFDASEMRHFDHGYAVTSHSSQGLTTDRVLVNMDTTAHPELINTRFAYVSVSRASEDARIYTNNATTLGERLSTDISKASAVEVARPNSETQAHQPQSKEQTMTNTKELTPEEQRRQFQQEAHDPATDKAQSPSEINQRHYTPIHTALPNEAAGYEWKRETGDIQSYQHNQTAGWLHIDPQGQFYDRHAQPIAKEHALEHAGHLTLTVNEISQAQSIAKGSVGIDQGLSL